jgi:hypothetical protein
VAHALDTTPNDSQWPDQEGLSASSGCRAHWDTSRGSSRDLSSASSTRVSIRASRDLARRARSRSQPRSIPRRRRSTTTVTARPSPGSSPRVPTTARAWPASAGSVVVMPVKVAGRSGGTGDGHADRGGNRLGRRSWARRVVNLSLGGPGSSPELAAALAYAASKGAVGPWPRPATAARLCRSIPQTDSTALSVAATTTTDRA